MSVSVVIPCYNAERTLAATLSSALDQGGVQEVIVVDDGSTDGSARVAAEFGDKVKLLSGPNRGVSLARNRGIERAQGEFILFLDSDDLLLPGTVERRLRMAEGCDLVLCQWEEIIGPEGKPAGSGRKSVDEATVRRDAELAFAVSDWAPPAALLYRRDLVQRIGGFSLTLPVIQDARFLFDAARCGARLGFSNHLGALYRIMPESVSRRSEHRFWLDVLANAREVEALWAAEGTISEIRRRSLAETYDGAARILLAHADAGFFGAVNAARAMGGPASRYVRFGSIIASLIGLRGASRLLASRK